ncbi:MAG: tetratricopeptide repeat protein [Pseudobdellovibrio sp.]
MDIGKFFETNYKAIFGVFAAFVVVGGIVTLVSNQSAAKEKKAQEAYFSVEKKFIEAKNPQAQDAEEKKPVEKPNLAQIKQDFEKVINDFPGSVASQMAALHVAGMNTEEKNYDQALAVLQKVENKDTGLVNTLVQQQIGQLLADKDKCAEAITVWQKILDRKEAAFLHDDVKLQQALCYSKTNDTKKAEEILTNLANKTANPDMAASTASKEAEKYLRLMQFKKASGT